MIMQMWVNVDWQCIHQKKQIQMQATLNHENHGQLEHKFAVGDKVLIIAQPGGWEAKMGKPTEGPYNVLKVKNNDTLTLLF